MAYYIQIQNNQIVDCSTSLLKNGINIEVSKEIFDDCSKNKNKYQPNETLDGIELNPNFEQEERQKELERVGNLTMTAQDFLFGYLNESLNVPFDVINAFLDSNAEFKLRLTTCQNVWCKAVCSLCPITIGEFQLTEDMVIQAFKLKNGEIEPTIGENAEVENEQ